MFLLKTRYDVHKLRLICAAAAPQNTCMHTKSKRRKQFRFKHTPTHTHTRNRKLSFSYLSDYQRIIKLRFGLLFYKFRLSEQFNVQCILLTMAGCILLFVELTSNGKWS